MKLSLIVPCYNEQDNVREFYDACSRAFADRINDYEIIFINDGSGANTLKELKKLYDSCGQGIKIISFSRNFGKEAGIYAGLQKAAGEYVTIIDADLQQRPEIVVQMVEFLDQHDEYDSVAAYQSERIEGRVTSWFKSAFYKIINKICEIDFRPDASDFRTFRRMVADAILDMPEYYRFSKGIFSWVGFQTYYMPYVAEERHSGKSSWSFGKLFRYAMEGIISFSSFPLKMASYAGGLCVAASLIYILVMIIRRLASGIDISGNAIIIFLILLIGGMLLSAVGIAGVYLARIYIQGKRRPVYVVKEYLTYEDEADRTQI